MNVTLFFTGLMANPGKTGITMMLNRFPGDYSSLEPPESISNSEVKQIRADDSVRSPHVKVGHRQGFI
jgi:hypothetical protein